MRYIVGDLTAQAAMVAISVSIHYSLELLLATPATIREFPARYRWYETISISQGQGRSLRFPLAEVFTALLEKSKIVMLAQPTRI